MKVVGYMKKIWKLLIIISIILIPKQALANNIDNYQIIMNAETEGKVSVQKIIEAPSEASIIETINQKIENYNVEISQPTSNISFDQASEKNKVHFNFTNFTNRIIFNYNLNIKYDDKTPVYYYPLINRNDKKITKLRFNIMLPRHSDDITFYINNKKVSKNKIDYSIDKNIITGQINNLPENTSLIIAVANEDYQSVTTFTKVAIALPIIGTFISYLLWYFFGKDLKIKIKATSLLPKTTTVLENTIVYKGKVTRNEVSYLLLELADKGYIRIDDTAQGTKIIKEKKYDGKNYLEALFMRKLFKQTKDNNIDEIYLSEIEMSQALNEIIEKINSPEVNHRFYEQSSSSKKIFIAIIVSLSLLLINYAPFIEYNKTSLLILGTFLALTTFYLITKIVESIDFESTESIQIILMFILCSVIIFIVSKFFFASEIIFVFAYLVGYMCSILMLILYKYMPKRTKKGSKVLNDLESLKYFLNNATLDDINNVLEVNNNYIYQIIPYTYLFNNKDEFLEKFADITITRPTWYRTKKIITIKEAYQKIEALLYNIK